MNRSGLSGNVSSAVFAFGALMIVLPFGIYEMRNVGREVNVIWPFVFAACVLGGLGLLSFNGMLAKADPMTVGSMLVLMMVVQVATPALYQTYMEGGLSASRAIGFAAAFLAAILLLKK
jgi:hypothetical protein